MLPTALRQLIEATLAEDIGSGDVTTQACIPADLRGTGTTHANASGVVSGGGVAAECCFALDPSAEAEWLPEGATVSPGDVVLTVRGQAQALLTAERTALNFLQHLSGVATLTARFVEAAGPSVIVVDTRKTTPGLRALEKAAVRAGGGRNHRFALYDGVLIKENHIAAAGGIANAVRECRLNAPHLLGIEVEARTLADVEEALESGADVIMLDNMDLAAMRTAVELVAHRVPLEASGGVTLENIRQIADTGVDLISVGALTHSAPTLDMSMDLAVGD
jgi:nicotinate-nucleotide pyrophosphorylase (carboxylating)